MVSVQDYTAGTHGPMIITFGMCTYYDHISGLFFYNSKFRKSNIENYCCDQKQF